MTTYLFTADLSSLVDETLTSPNGTRARAYLVPYGGVVVNGSDTLIGSARLTLDANDALSIVAPGGVYWVEVRYYDPVTAQMVTWTSVTFLLDANKDLSTIVPTTVSLSAVPSTLLDLQNAIASVNAISGLTGEDAAVANLVNNAASASRVALDAKYRVRFNVKLFGAVGDGTTNDASAIQSAINAAAALGGNVYCPGATYKINSTLTNTESNVLIEGDGGDSSHDTGTNLADAATVLLWGGSAGGTMVSFSSPTAAGDQTRTGGGVRGIAFNSGATVAGTGLSITSWRDGAFEDLYFQEFATTDILVTCSTGGGEARDSQRNRFVNVRFRQVVAAGCFLTLDGSATANASFNYFQDCAGNFTGSATTGAFNLRNSDNNLFVQCVAYMVTSGTAVVCHAGASAGVTCRDNVFMHFSTNGSIMCKGTEEFASPSTNNVFLNLDSSNSTPAPTRGTGTTAWWSFTSGLHERMMVSGVNAGATAAMAVTARDSMTGVLRVVDGSDNQAQFATSDLAAWWSVAVLGTGGHFRITPLAGSGRIMLNANTIITGQAGFNNTTPIAKPTVTGSRGGNAALASLLTALANYGLITDSSTA